MRNEELFIEPQAGRIPLLKLIKSAKKNIKLWMFCVEDQLLTSALIEAKKRGVTIEIITKNANTYLHPLIPSEQIYYTQMEQHSISITGASTAFAYMHAKVMIIDEEIVCIMTLNYQTSTFIGSIDCGIIFSDQEIISYLLELFECDLQNAANNTAITTANPPSSLVVSPLNGQNALLQFLNKATTSLIISTADFDYVFLDELEQLIRNGCYVRLIVATVDSAYTYEKAINIGIDIRILTNKQYGTFEDLYMHAKTAVADGAYCFLGSQNFTLYSFAKNREIGYLTDNPKTVIQLLTQLEKAWSIAKPLALNKIKPHISPSFPSASSPKILPNNERNNGS